MCIHMTSRQLAATALNEEHAILKVSDPRVKRLLESPSCRLKPYHDHICVYCLVGLKAKSTSKHRAQHFEELLTLGSDEKRKWEQEWKSRLDTADLSAGNGVTFYVFGLSLASCCGV